MLHKLNECIILERSGVRRALGSIGHLMAFSFPWKQKILFQAEGGGMLTINDDRFVNEAEIIWEETNRARVF
jgi:dTDP-4-amino-4,6-dideoxygalactose transaminase